MSLTLKQQTAYDKIRNRCDLFEKHHLVYTSSKTSGKNETEVRTNFIDVFWEALGWDMRNEQGKDPDREEVLREESTPRNDGRIGNSDYTFRDDDGRPLFFVEAKRPYVNINKDAESAYQIRDYAFNSSHSIGVLTDFEEFAIYDSTAKPLKTDISTKSRLAYYNFKDYREEAVFLILWNTFARENVLRGSLPAYQVRTQTDKSFSKPVDKQFLEDLERWRTRLAAAILRDNPDIAIDDLVFVVQATINRIVFLRVCEDRHIEPLEMLKNAITNITTNGLVYQNLLQVFARANTRYNAGLFDLSLHNNIATRIFINNKDIRSIVTDLYFPESPYRFEIISPEILGIAYEQFLGKTIRLERTNSTTLNRAGQKVPQLNVIVEYKPEVRKAGGVFYTPQYVVRYIVKNTVGKLITSPDPSTGREITPADVAKLTFCDPACGSGSFLLGVYQYLIDWHTRYYNLHPPKAQPNKPLPIIDGQLTIAARKRILTNNIYGVDIDAQAIEVTKLSLLICCLANTETLSAAEEYRHLLPNIDANIQCGNSLIDTEFSWQTQFPNVFAAGGFDAVVGNPPYGATLDEVQKIYLKQAYQSFGWRGESYVLFTEKATHLLKPNGYLGYIIPDTYLNLDFTKPMRDFLLQQTLINEIIVLPANIFKDATVDTTILIVQKAKQSTTGLFCLFCRNRAKLF
jgi:type I restriction-modification system DNA methylase subunit/predicted type IV restriction endonuclease